MKKLYLIRHGETELNKTKVYYGATDCPLNDKGREQSQALTKVFAEIPIDTIYVSPLKRAIETENIIFGSDKIPLHTDQRLKEMNFGLWEGKHYLELKDDPHYILWQNDWENTKAPQGESFTDLALRVESFYQDLLNIPEDNVAIVCHSAVLMMLLPYIFSLKPQMGWHVSFEQGKYTYIEIVDGFPVLKNLNS